MNYLTIDTVEKVNEMFAKHPSVIIDVLPDDGVNQDRDDKTQYHYATVLREHHNRYVSDVKFQCDVSADMVEHIATMPNIVLRHAQPSPSFELHKFYCLRSLFIENSLDVNKGFPEGMTSKDLKVGAVVELCWRDAEPSIGVVIDVDNHAHNYKGRRSFKTLDASGVIQRAEHTQIVELVERDVLLLLTAGRKHVDALLAIEQIAQGQTNKKLRQVCDIASEALGAL